MDLTLGLFVLLTACSHCSGQQIQRSSRCDDENISAKARRHFCSETSSVSAPPPVIEEEEEAVTTEDITEVSPYFNFEEETSLVRPERPIEYQVPETTPKSTFFDEDGTPFCDELMEGFDDMSDCLNRTEPELITKWRDVVLEKLISQTWRDTKANIENNKEYAGVKLNPLLVDSLVESEPAVSFSQTTKIYSADIKMWNITVLGLSSIYINQILVTRAQNLYDLDIKVVFQIDKLSVTGMYNLVGSIGGDWFGTSVTSDGDWPFSIDIINATLSPQITVDTSMKANAECDKIGDVVITNLGIPFNYEDISINFDNLGSGYNTLINGISLFFLKTQEETLVSSFKRTIKEKVHSIIC